MWCCGGKSNLHGTILSYRPSSLYLINTQFAWTNIILTLYNLGFFFFPYNFFFLSFSFLLFHLVPIEYMCIACARFNWIVNVIYFCFIWCPLYIDSTMQSTQTKLNTRSFGVMDLKIGIQLIYIYTYIYRKYLYEIHFSCIYYLHQFFRSIKRSHGRKCFAFLNRESG